MKRDTVIGETPANFATSCKVTRLRLRRFFFIKSVPQFLAILSNGTHPNITRCQLQHREFTVLLLRIRLTDRNPHGRTQWPENPCMYLSHIEIIARRQREPQFNRDLKFTETDCLVMTLAVLNEILF
jgi:hypothetical protein